MHEPVTATHGRVASIHLHPAKSGEPMSSVEVVELIADKGLQGEPRYFAKVSSRTGQPSRRQVSLIEREEVQEHATALGLESIPPGVVRSNLETAGVRLLQLIGRKVQIGSAILLIHTPRDPCEKMDAICMGLRARMENDRQGVLAEIVQSGTVRVGDTLQPL